VDRRAPFLLTRSATLVVALCFVTVAAIALVARPQLGPLTWLLLAPPVIGLVILFAGRSKKASEDDDEVLMEQALQAIRQEAERLDSRREEIEKVLMAYGEWMEFPDFDELREDDWATPARSEQDATVASLLDIEADRMLGRFSSGEYWNDGQFRTQALLLDLYKFMEGISRIYLPEAERPLLETNLESLLRAVNRASLQVILLLEEIPILEAKELNLRKVADGVRKASKVVRKYEDLQPYLEPVRYLWQGSKLLLASNPLFAAGWIAGSELIRQGGKKYGKKALDGYLLSLLRQTLGIIAWETASVYDRTHRYRNPEFVFAVELTHLTSLFPLEPELMRDALQELEKTPFRSTYDRIFLYRCLAQHVSPKPKNFAQPDLLEKETREAIFTRLQSFRSRHLSEAREKDLSAWESALANRLQLSSSSE
jgi:hypothetical protein